MLDRTPAYADGGGQVADEGAIEATGVRAVLTHVLREDESIVHRVRLERGTRDGAAGRRRGRRLRVRIAPERRLPTMRHHTATHLLHEALRAVLGEHVRQAGSLVSPERLRFDYTHFEAPSPEQLAGIEERVNDWTLADRPVDWAVMPIERAKSLGAMMLFGEKYGAEVRLVSTEGVPEQGIAGSRELCGGTHVSRTGEIGAFWLLSDSAIASGVRRIEAVCGHEALRHARSQAALLQRAAGLLQTAPRTCPGSSRSCAREVERLRREQAEARRGGLEAEMETLAAGATRAPGGRWAVAEVRLGGRHERGARGGRQAARPAGSGARGAGVCRAAAGSPSCGGDRRSGAGEEAQCRRAGEPGGAVTGGKGGGKPHLALAGGKDTAKLEAALDEARRLRASSWRVVSARGGTAMKALVLAGGRGTRLRPITHTAAKQLVPVANKPVLFYGLEALRDAGIRRVGIVVSDPREMLQPDARTGERTTVMVNSQAEIRAAVGDGSRFGLEVTYIEQEAPLGLAHAVKISEDFLRDEPFVMYLGDNLIKDGIAPFVREFEAEQPDAQILLAHVTDAAGLRRGRARGRPRRAARGEAEAAALRPGAGGRVPVRRLRLRRRARHPPEPARRARDHRRHPAPHRRRQARALARHPGLVEGHRQGRGHARGQPHDARWGWPPTCGARWTPRTEIEGGVVDRAGQRGRALAPARAADHRRERPHPRRLRRAVHARWPTAWCSSAARSSTRSCSSAATSPTSRGASSRA